ncbi:MAG: gas vesicle protein GvpG [Desulfobacter sp.]
MIILDDIILSPFKGIYWLVRQINTAVEEEQALDAENITRELSELYMMLETGRITEAEFDEQEARLLDRLDEIRGTAGAVEDAEDLDDEWDDDPDDPDEYGEDADGEDGI